jgi:lipopolysaccharide/colanic/teichoic acid biosynthesis glycosyltransferase/dTDP-glucose pyrophosphorylase
MNAKAVIAAGGLQSRAIHPVNISKTFFPLLNRPAIEHSLDALGGLGISEAFLTVGPNEISLAELPNRSNGLAVHTVIEDHPRGTAGCLRQVSDRLNGHTLIVVAGNLLFFAKEDLAKMMQYHRDSAADLTVGLISAANRNGMDTEKVCIGSDGNIESIERFYPSVKHNGGPTTSGLYIMESHVLDQIRDTGFFDLKEQLVPQLRKVGKTIRGWTHESYSSSARTMDDYLRANFDCLKNYDLAKKYLKNYREIKRHVWVGRDVDISPSATLVRPLIIGSNVRIEAGASIVGPSIIGDGCLVAANSLVRESVLWPNSYVPFDFEVEKCLISGKAFSTENGHCREMVLVNGDPSLNNGSGTKEKGLSRKVALKSVRSARAEKTYLTVKRFFDLAVAAFLLIPALPFFALIAILIKLDSRGPAFFLQNRCGKDGIPFRMIKFRSMVENAEKLKRTYRHLNRADGPMFKIENDPRETRFGRILRSCKLDELPQLLNVLRGEMSLVGPRPLSMNEMRYNPHWRDARLSVKPGLTGLWQVKEKDEHAFHEWIQYDLQYVDERSHWLDLKIFLGTFLKVLNMAFDMVKHAFSSATPPKAGS